MPFGFERNLQRENEEAAKMQTDRECIAVSVVFTPEGKLTPVAFTWKGREYKIERVLNCRPGNSLKNPTAGARYECVIRNKRFYLYFTGEKWYLDF